MKASLDSTALCSALDRFGLPRAVAYAEADTFIVGTEPFWTGQAFQRRRFE